MRTLMIDLPISVQIVTSALMGGLTIDLLCVQQPPLIIISHSNPVLESWGQARFR